MTNDDDLAVVFVEFDERIAIREDGSRIPITNIVDADGDETSDPLLARQMVAGPLPSGKWLAFSVEAIAAQGAVN